MSENSNFSLLPLFPLPPLSLPIYPNYPRPTPLFLPFSLLLPSPPLLLSFVPPPSPAQALSPPRSSSARPPNSASTKLTTWQASVRVEEEEVEEVEEVKEVEEVEGEEEGEGEVIPLFLLLLDPAVEQAGIHQLEIGTYLRLPIMTHYPLLRYKNWYGFLLFLLFPFIPSFSPSVFP